MSSDPFENIWSWMTIVIFLKKMYYCCIGELFIENFQSFEIFGDMYQDTEAFCIRVTLCEILQEKKNQQRSNFTYLEKTKSGKSGTLTNCAKEIWKLSEEAEYSRKNERI